MYLAGNYCITCSIFCVRNEGGSNQSPKIWDRVYERPWEPLQWTRYSSGVSILLKISWQIFLSFQRYEAERNVEQTCCTLEQIVKNCSRCLCEDAFYVINGLCIVGDIEEIPIVQCAYTVWETAHGNERWSIVDMCAVIGQTGGWASSFLPPSSFSHSSPSPHRRPRLAPPSGRSPRSFHLTPAVLLVRILQTTISVWA